MCIVKKNSPGYRYYPRPRMHLVAPEYARESNPPETRVYVIRCTLNNSNIHFTKLREVDEVPLSLPFSLSIVRNLREIRP